MEYTKNNSMSSIYSKIQKMESPRDSGNFNVVANRPPPPNYVKSQGRCHEEYDSKKVRIVKKMEVEDELKKARNVKSMEIEDELNKARIIKSREVEDDLKKARIIKSREVGDELKKARIIKSREVENSTADINESAEAFINRFRHQLKIERLDSIENFNQRLQRGL